MTRPPVPAFLALSCIGAAALTGVAQAQAQSSVQGDSGNERLGGITVTGTVMEENDGEVLESPKRTRTVRDTPQTITVISGEVIEQQNLLTLRDVLSTVPGITFGAGEGGGGYGDSITFRGYSANTDITVDGVRDSAQYTRTDPFNLEQIEVTNGANSVISGAGSVGGNINLTTKRPKSYNDLEFSGGIGTDDYYRATIDANALVADGIAVRINAMQHQNNVPGRDFESFERYGIAPSVTFGIDAPTRLTLQYFHQEDDNIPQYGVPYYTSGGMSGPVPGVDDSSYFGNRNVDRQRTNVDNATAIIEHDFSDNVTIRNLTRWQDVRQLTRVSPPQGTYCVAATGLTPAGAACAVSGVGTIPAGYAYLSGPRGNTRDTRNQLVFNQTDVTAVFNTGVIEHTIDLGFAASWEKYDLLSGNWTRNADGSPISAAVLLNIANPDEVVPGPDGFTYGSNLWLGPTNFVPSSRTTGEQENYAAYLFDTMRLGRFELNGGIRYEAVDGWSRTDAIAGSTSTQLGTITPGTRFDNDAELFSYRVGLVYKPVEAVSIYAAYGNSRTPSRASVNGSCTAATCNVDPESAENIEIGAKAQLGAGVLVSIAAFRNQRNQYLVASNDPGEPDQQLNGNARVDGIALGANGQITPEWNVTANYTYLDGELRQSVSDFCLASPAQPLPGNTWSNGCTNSVAYPDPAAGSSFANTPEHSGSLFTTYTLPFGLTVGYGVTYQGSFAFGTPSLNVTRTELVPAPESEEYWVHQAFFSYAFTPNLTARVNVRNLFDQDYYTRIRNNGWATPGEARQAVLTLVAGL